VDPLVISGLRRRLSGPAAHIVTEFTGLIRNDGAFKAIPPPIRAVEDRRERFTRIRPLGSAVTVPTSGNWAVKRHRLAKRPVLRICRENPTSGE
jgi:hypothetical protein